MANKFLDIKLLPLIVTIGISASLVNKTTFGSTVFRNPPLKPSHSELASESPDQIRLEQSDFLFKQSLKTQKDIETLVSQKVKNGFHVEHVILGRGVAATNLFARKFRRDSGVSRHTRHPEHEVLTSVQSEMSQVLAIGFDRGNWNEINYSLAQPQNLLENPELPFGPGDFISTEDLTDNVYVDAKTMYQATVINQVLFKMPFLNAIVTEISANQESGYPYSLRLKLPGAKKSIRILAKSIDICSGLGAERNIFPEYEGKKYMNDLAFTDASRTDPVLGAKRIIGGYEYMLSNKPFEHIPTGFDGKPYRKTILVYGGGGNATAVVRKSLFNHDRPDAVVAGLRSPDEAVNDVYWIARSGVDAAGSGTKAMQAIEFCTRFKRLIIAELQSVTNFNYALLVTYHRFTPLNHDELAFHNFLTPTDDLSKEAVDALPETSDPYIDSKLRSGEKILTKWKINGVVVPVYAESESIVCDQFVYSVGAEANGGEAHPGVRALVKKLAPMQLLKTSGGVPLAWTNQEKSVQIHGAAAVSYGWEFFDSLRTNELANRATLDGEWPGVMPPTFAAMKLLPECGPVTTINLMTDFLEAIDLFLKESHFTEIEREQFINKVIHWRRTMEPWGLSGADLSHELNSLLSLLNKQDMLEIIPGSLSTIRRSASHWNRFNKSLKLSTKPGSNPELLSEFDRIIMMIRSISL